MRHFFGYILVDGNLVSAELSEMYKGTRRKTLDVFYILPLEGKISLLEVEDSPVEILPGYTKFNSGRSREHSCLYLTFG